MLSEWTCVRSSLFLARVLTFARGSAAQVRSGTEGDGAFWGGEWRSHAWVVCEDAIVDITADQFGGPEVIVVPAPDARYREGGSEARRLPISGRQVSAVDLIWPSWVEIGAGCGGFG